MAPKQQLEKTAWQWAEVTNPEDVGDQHIKIAYRTDLQICIPGVCRRNCKANPNCLVGLGEREWLCEIKDEVWHDVEDPNGERRAKGSFVGLKNLGATCYVNTFLQVWFHNPVFRSAILQFKEVEEASQKSDEPVEGSAKWVPKTVCGQLQLIFALLLHSSRRYIDPTPFITSLGLDTTQQQDAQEFSKLFISLLEDTLSQQLEAKVRNLVNDQLRGLYDYVTTCTNCGSTSNRPSTFYELDLNIKGHKLLSECIDEFLQEEKLEGDNRYMCSQCQSKQDATRRIQLRQLPPVLNMQLLRFVFERQTGHKKKLNTFIQFPEMIDMSQYVGKPEGEVVYELHAVLIHRGPSAYSGHYIAHIKDRPSRTWYKFNDEEIDKMGGKNLQLGNESEFTDSGNKSVGKMPKTPKGFHCSRNAYMLVYCLKNAQTHQGDPAPVPIALLPRQVQQYIHDDNAEFETWIDDMIKMRDENVSKGKARQNEIKDIFGMISIEPETSGEWIPTKWLTKWLSCEKADQVPAIDNSGILCQHSRLDPDRVSNAKCVSNKASDMLYSKYTGGPRLMNPESLCRECVVSRCRVIRTRARIAEDSKVIAAMMKNKKDTLVNTDGCFWVGKTSLRGWKGLAMDQFEKSVKAEGLDMDSGDPPSTGDSKPNTTEGKGDQQTPLTENGAKQEIAASKDEAMSKTVESEDKGSNNENLSFNEDIVCALHGGLDIDVNCRTLVPGDIWHRLKTHFPTAAEFSAATEPCRQCVDPQNKRRKQWVQFVTHKYNLGTQAFKMLQESEEKAKAKNKTMAAEQKGLLPNLYLDKQRPSWKKEVTELAMVTRDFLEEWRRYLREPQKRDPVRTTNNRSVLCDHGLLPFQLNAIGADSPNANLVYVWPMEIDILKSFATVDVDINVVRVQEENGQVTFVTSPDMCQACCQRRLEIEENRHLQYVDASIYIRKSTDESQLMTGSREFPSVDRVPVNGNASDEEQDTEYIQNGFSQKRKKCQESPVVKVAKVTAAGVKGGDSSIRRSSRHRRMRGEKEVIVSATNTLRDLKLKVMKAFSVAPFDQHLTLDCRELQGDQELLSTLRVFPGSVIYLKADEPVGDPTFYDEPIKGGVTEEGFKGTGLLGR